MCCCSCGDRRCYRPSSLSGCSTAPSAHGCASRPPATSADVGAQRREPIEPVSSRYRGEVDDQGLVPAGAHERKQAIRTDAGALGIDEGMEIDLIGIEQDFVEDH